MGAGAHGPSILSAMTAAASTDTFAVTNSITDEV